MTDGVLPTIPFDPDAADLDVRTLVLIVAGSTLEAEAADRALAAALAARIAAHESAVAADGGAPWRPLVVSDLRWVNDAALRLQPTIAVGRPEINAATAAIARGVPTAMVVDGAWRIQLEPEGTETRCCVWGVDATRTRDALQVFSDRHLSAFLDATRLLLGR